MFNPWAFLFYLCCCFIVCSCFHVSFVFVLFYRFVSLSSTGLQYSRSNFFHLLHILACFVVDGQHDVHHRECAALLAGFFVLSGFWKITSIVFNSFSCLHSLFLFQRNKQRWKKLLLSNRNLCEIQVNIASLVHLSLFESSFTA